MSRLPRHLEHLKTGFTAEAVSAAMYRAFAVKAESEGRSHLAERWRALAVEKDRLSMEQLQAAGKVQSDERNLRDAIAEERYENEVLYPRLMADMEHFERPEELAVFRDVVERQKKHLELLERLRHDLTGAGGDVPEAEPVAVG